MTEKYRRSHHRSGGHHSGHAHAHSGHHHHGRRSVLKHRFKRWLRKHKWTAIAAVMLVIVLAATALWMRSDMKNRMRYQVSSGHNVDVSGYQDIKYKGHTYRYNNRVTAILYAGIDSDTTMEAPGAYAGAPRADSISLVVMDELHERISIIALNRDTMTGIHKFTVDGKDRGSFTDHLALAFAYGDGGRKSCENLCLAVSDLLYGVPISGYVVSNRASLPLLGDLVGPVEVVVPNDDIEDQGFIAGETVTIDSDNLASFVRSRDSETDFSNVGRMERQQAYINAAIDKIMSLLTKDTNTAWDFMKRAEAYVETDITRNRYLNLVKILKNTHYSADNYYTPDGEQVVGRRYDEFYPDMDSLQEKVIELFYIER